MFDKPDSEQNDLFAEEASAKWNAPGADPGVPPSMDGRPSTRWTESTPPNPPAHTNAFGGDTSSVTPVTPSAPPSDGVTFKFGSPSAPEAPSSGFSNPEPPRAVGTPPPPPPAPPTTRAASFAPSTGVNPAEYNFTQAPPPEPPQKRRLGRWLASAVGALALLVAGLFIGSQLGNDSATDTAQTETAVADTTDASATTSASSAGADSSASDSDAAGTSAGEPATTTDANSQSSTVAVNSAVVGSLEPIADVAEILSPSVVQISDNAGGSGSGIVYDFDGHIVTNAHVVDESTTVTVIFQDGLRVEGTVVGTDPETDVAAVKVNPDEVSNLTVARFAEVADLRAGATAIAIGSPFGYDQTITAGIVSSTRRPVASMDTAEFNTTVPMIQTDAPINPGNSGGALADITGAVIGMNTLIRSSGSLTGGTGNIGIGFAIPSDIIQLVADGLIAEDPVKPSLLGVSTQGSADFVLGEPGARVTQVTNEGPADLAGIQIGDRLTRFDGVPLSDFKDLAGVVRLSEAGVPLPVELYRDGEFLRFDVELVTR